MAKDWRHETAEWRFANLCGKTILLAQRKGFAEPFYLEARDTKGAVYVGRAEYSKAVDRLEVTTLRTDPPGGVISIPLILLLKDAQGRTMRRTLK